MIVKYIPSVMPFLTTTELHLIIKAKHVCVSLPEKNMTWHKIFNAKTEKQKILKT